MAFKFEKLEVWKEAVELSTGLSVLVKSFPKDEMFVLSSQLKRAADSIALNIAEGSTGQTNKEFSRFLSIALRSGIEVVSCLHLGKSRGIIHHTDFDLYYGKLETLIIRIQALRKYLNTSTSDIMKEPNEDYNTINDGLSTID